MWVQMVKKQFTVISTFAGGGGSSLGYHWTGFRELLAIDFDKNSCDTLKANFDFPVWQRDVKEITADEILKFCKIKKGQLDILDGSPPCQGFSTAGKRNLNDNRNDLFLDFVRLIEGLQPKVFVMENVSGMIKGGYKGKFNEILYILKNIGYNVKVKLMNAMWYEVPQSRERVFFIGVRNDLKIEPSFPKPLNKIITVKEAIYDLENRDIPEINHKRHYRALDSKSVINWAKTKHGDPVLGQSLYKLNPNKPCNTIKKSSELFHYSENRILTIREVARLSSFPDNYMFIGNQGWERIGNAVMPKMMYHIAKHIKENILTKKTTK